MTTRDAHGLTAARHDHVVNVHDHVVNVYEDHAHIVEDATEYLLDGLGGGGAAIAIATCDHLEAIDEGLDRSGVDPCAARRRGRYVAVDAAATLARCMARGRVDREAFDATVEPLVERGAAGGRDVRAFGEMVSLLWERDDPSGAIALESLWNDLAARRAFGLHCGYSEASLGAHGPLDAVGQVCAQHRAIVLPRSYQRPGGRRPVVPADDTCSRVFLPHLTAVRAVRRFVVDVLACWGCEALSDEAALVASELATNAVMHTAGPFRVALERDAVSVTIRVSDTSPLLPQRRAPVAQTEGGRGLMLVEGLAARSGSEPAAGGKTVWAVLSLAESRA